MKKLISTLLVLMLALGLGSGLAESAPLPPFANPFGSKDPVMHAVMEYLLDTDLGFEAGEDGVLIPTPIVLKTEISEDATRATVWGNFWIFTYARNGKILERTACGENPGVMTLEQNDGVWTVTSLEVARDGGLYQEDIARFADGDEELAKLFARTTGSADDSFLPQYQRAAVVLYVTENGLDIEAMREPGGEPVSVID